MRNKAQLLAGAALAAALVAAWGPLAHAQDADAARRSIGETAIEEIVVTARKREENLQSVPIAVTAFTQEQLRSKNIVQPLDLMYNTPALTVQSRFIRQDANYVIRGFGGASSLGGSGAVTLYFAGAPGGEGQPILYDMANVQVLKGPQGTLFGQTSTGGAVQFEPQRPRPEFGGNIQVRLGSLSLREVTAAVNVPLSDQLMVRAAGQLTRRNGFTRNLDTGQMHDEQHLDSFRASAIWKPTDWFESYTLAQFDNGKHRTTGTVLYFANPNLPTLNSPASAFTAVCTTAATLSGVATAERAAFVAGCQTQRVGILAQIRNFYVSESSRVASGAQGGIRAFHSTDPGRRYNSSWAIRQQLLFSIGDIGPVEDIAFKAILGATYPTKSINEYELDGSNLRLGDTISRAGNFRPGVCAISGPTIGQCTVGEADGDTPRGSYDSDTLEPTLSFNVTDHFKFLLGYFQGFSRTEPNAPTTFETLENVFQPRRDVNPSTPVTLLSKNREDAVFGSVTVDLSDWVVQGLRVTAGYRRSWIERFSKTRTFSPATGAFGPVILNGPTIDKGPNRNLSVEWQVDPKLLVYVRHGTGFRPGGVNTICQQNPTPDCVPDYSAERIKDVEFGFKADWEVAGVRSRTNVAVYKDWYTDIIRRFQTTTGTAASSINVNVASATVKGFEVEHSSIFADGRISIGVAYSYLDAAYDRWFSQLLPTFPCTDRVNNSRNDCQDLSNNKFGAAPKHQLNLNATVRIVDSDEFGHLSAVLSRYWQSGVWHTDVPHLNIHTFQKAYSISNFRMDWRAAMGRPIDVSVFVRNVFQKKYSLGFSEQPGLGWAVATWAEPRTYGVELRYRFGYEE